MPDHQCPKDGPCHDYEAHMQIAVNRSVEGAMERLMDDLRDASVPNPPPDQPLVPDEVLRYYLRESYQLPEFEEGGYDHLHGAFVEWFRVLTDASRNPDTHAELARTALYWKQRAQARLPTTDLARLDVMWQEMVAERYQLRAQLAQAHDAIRGLLGMHVEGFHVDGGVMGGPLVDEFDICDEVKAARACLPESQ